MEVTIVILLVGILAAVAAPRLADSVRVIRLRAAAVQLAAHIDYIRRAAVNEGRSQSLICDNQLHTYGSDTLDFPQRVGQRLQVSLPQQYDATFTLKADFDSQSTMSFDFEGVPHVGAVPMTDGRIVISSGNDQIAVIIAAGTGVTTIDHLDADPT